MNAAELTVSRSQFVKRFSGERPGNWAVYGPEGEASPYRYLLGRDLEPNRTAPMFADRVHTVVFVMLNPSTATQDDDDPTIRRCIGYAKTWSYRYLVIANLFALRSADPSALYTHPDPVGQFNDAALVSQTMEGGPVICAWGNHGTLKNRGVQVAHRLHTIGAQLHALALTKAGIPGHPLYLKADLLPERWAP